MAISKQQVILLSTKQRETQVLAAALLIAKHLEEEERRREREKGKRRKKRNVWVKKSGTHQRRQQFGHYANLMVELKEQDEVAFRNFTRLPAWLFEELEMHVGPHIKKQ